MIQIIILNVALVIIVSLFWTNDFGPLKDKNIIRLIISILVACIYIFIKGYFEGKYNVSELTSDIITLVSVVLICLIDRLVMPKLSKRTNKNQ